MSSSSHSERSCVRFGDCDDVYEIQHLNDMTEEEVADRWLQPDEFRAIHVGFNSIVERMMRGEKIKEDDDTCERGLDCWLPDVADEKTSTIEAAVHAVLAEQNMQYDDNVYDPLTMAEAYSRCCGEAVFLAHSTGLEDERVALNIHQASKLSPKENKRKGRRGVLALMKGVSKSMRLRR